MDNEQIIKELTETAARSRSNTKRHFCKGRIHNAAECVCII